MCLKEKQFTKSNTVFRGYVELKMLEICYMTTQNLSIHTQTHKFISWTMWFGMSETLTSFLSFPSLQTFYGMAINHRNDNINFSIL